MSKKEIAKLKLTLQQINSAILRVNRFLVEHENDSLDNILIKQLEARAETLKDNFIRYQETQLQLLYLSPEEDDTSDTFENIYYDILTKLNLILNSPPHGPETQQPVQSIVSSADRGPTLNPQASIFSPGSISSAKLPCIEIPEFDGKNISQYKPFIEIFSAVIDKNVSLSNVEKLFYLRNYVKGEALSLINNLPIVNSFYVDALALLNNRYNNEVMIINSHINLILDIAPVQKGTAEALRQFVSIIRQQLGALKNLNQPIDKWDMILICSLSKKLDYYTNREYQTARDTTELPTIESFLHFLENRANILETVIPNSSSQAKKQNSKFNFKLEPENTKCVFCRVEGHRAYNCAKFKSMPIKERIDFVNRNKVCQICLNIHPGKCRFTFKCKSCSKRHNTLLHLDKELDSTEDPSRRYQVNKVISNSNCNVLYNSVDNIILPTVTVKVKALNGSYVNARCLLDSGSQMSLISKDFAKKLQLKFIKNHFNIVSVSESMTSVKECVFLNIKSNQHEFDISAKCAIVEKISSLPQFEFDSVKRFDLPTGIKLADPEFSNPSEIHILLSADIFFNALLPDKIKFDNGIILQETLLGYVVCGTLFSNSVGCNSIVSNHLFYKPDIDHLVSKFWEMEKVPQIHTFI